MAASPLWRPAPIGRIDRPGDWDVEISFGPNALLAYRAECRSVPRFGLIVSDILMFDPVRCGVGWDSPLRRLCYFDDLNTDYESDPIIRPVSWLGLCFPVCLVGPTDRRGPLMPGVRLYMQGQLIEHYRSSPAFGLRDTYLLKVAFQ
jgi:hypothetical protein